MLSIIHNFHLRLFFFLSPSVSLLFFDSRNTFPFGIVLSLVPAATDSPGQIYAATAATDVWL